jgi:hypothetical protein
LLGCAGPSLVLGYFNQANDTIAAFKVGLKRRKEFAQLFPRNAQGLVGCIVEFEGVEHLRVEFASAAPIGLFAGTAEDLDLHRYTPCPLWLAVVVSQRRPGEAWLP